MHGRLADMAEGGPEVDLLLILNAMPVGAWEGGFMGGFRGGEGWPGANCRTDWVIDLFLTNSL